MKHCEKPLPKHGVSASKAVEEEIQRALEMMKRVRMANPDQADKTVDEPQGNRYILPEPLVFKSSPVS